MKDFDSKLTIDTFIIKAASKAFSKVFKMSNVDVATVKGQVSIIKSAEKLNLN